MTNNDDNDEKIEESDELDDSILGEDIDDTDDTTMPPKVKKSVSDIIRYIIMTVAVIVFCYSAFMLIKIYWGYKQGNDIYKSINQSVLATVESNSSSDDNMDDDQLPFKYDHNALLGINSEGIGYLYIPSISLQLPLVQGTDNDYYLTHTFNKTYNGAGTLFEDYRIDDKLDATNVIIYGHNMKNGSMFAGLSKYLTASFCATTGNDIFYIYTENSLREYQIFSTYISEPVSDTYTYNFGSLSSLEVYASTMKGLSSYNMDVDVSNATQVITFSTCTADGSQRIIVHGTFIGESTLAE